MKLELTRHFDNGKQTLGTMLVLNEQDATIFKMATLELPWKDNQRKISCIPAGKYICKKVPASSPTNLNYEHIWITNVANRDGICIHKGNYYTQILGCILVGQNHIDLNGDGEKDVNYSGKVFDKLMALMPDEFQLTIK